MILNSPLLNVIGKLCLEVLDTGGAQPYHDTVMVVLVDHALSQWVMLFDLLEHIIDGGVMFSGKPIFL